MWKAWGIGTLLEDKIPKKEEEDSNIKFVCRLNFCKVFEKNIFKTSNHRIKNKIIRCDSYYFLYIHIKYCHFSLLFLYELITLITNVKKYASVFFSSFRCQLKHILNVTIFYIFISNGRTRKFRYYMVEM